MLKLSHQGVNSLQKFKCGEVFCITAAAVFNVSCCICGSEIHLEQFSSHFQIQHLTLAEESINLEVVENKSKDNLANDSCVLEHTPIKEVNAADYRIKQEVLECSAKSTNSLEDDTDDDEDNKCLQELVIASKARQKKRNYRENFKEDTNKIVVPKKYITRNAQSRQFVIEEKLEDPLQTKDCDGEILVTPLVVENLSKDELDYNEVEIEENNHVAEKDLSAEENDSDSNSDRDKDQSVTDKKDLTAEFPFSCPLCSNRSYRTKAGLQKHNHSVHNPNKPPRKRKGSKPQHKCDICNEVFRSPRVLRGHRWKHTGIVCDICGKSFTQSGHLKRHKLRHTGIKAFKCKECNKEFFTSKELKSHMVSHTKVMAVICEICGKGCRNQGVFTAHMRRHTGERPAKCDVCGKSFFSGHDLNVHAVTHTSERPFKCDICGSTFQRKKALRVHKLIHSKDRKHVCRICGKGFAQSGGLNSHMRSHDSAIEKTTTSTEIGSAVLIPVDVLLSSAESNPQTEINVVSGSGELEDQLICEYVSVRNKDQSFPDEKDLSDELPFPCPICKRSYSTKHGLQKHNHSVHNPNKPPRKRKGSKPQHKCDICNEVFRSAPVLRGHQWKHTGIFCDICGKSFTQSGHLKRHKIRHTGIKAFKCKECNKDFFTTKELKSHMVSHTKVMAVICEICGKGCRNQGVFTAHMRRHTGERPAKCDVCGKSFFSGHDLNVHAVTHTSERPFKCDICGSTFQRKKALRVHKLIHSKDRNHVCRVCGKGFAQSGGLNSHMRSHDAAVEKTTTSIETASPVHIPTVVLMSSVESNPQTETDIVSDSRELEDQVICEYMV